MVRAVRLSELFRTYQTEFTAGAKEVITRAMEEANKHNVPVFLNFEHGHKNPELLKRYAGMVTICQAVTDAAQIEARVLAWLAGQDDLIRTFASRPAVRRCATSESRPSRDVASQLKYSADPPVSA